MLKDNKSRLILLLLALLVSHTAVAQTQSVVVLFGDSITVGFNSGRPVINGNASTTLSGPRQFLSDLLNNPDEPRFSTVVNLGEGGTSSMRGVQRISSQLAEVRSLVPGDRFFVLIMYGTNDFGRGIGTGTTAFNNRVMIDLARSQGYIPVTGNVTPRSDRDLLPLAGAIFNAASASNAPVVDHFTAFSQQPLAELIEEEISFLSGQLIRLHPNDVGYQLLVDNWFNQALRNLIPPFVQAEPSLFLSPVINLLLDEDE